MKEIPLTQGKVALVSDCDYEHLSQFHWYLNSVRVCTRHENSMNRQKHKNFTSHYKGVSWHKAKGMWRAVIKINGKSKHLGNFPNEELAATAYNDAASKMFSSFSSPNCVLLEA